MWKLVVAFVVLFCCTLLKAQYETFPRLEALYSEGKYDKCLEKVEEEIKKNSKEIYPYIWQMRCYLAIDELENHPLKKNALSKALNTAIRIKSKDKSGELSGEVKADFETIQTRLFAKISNMNDEQYTAGIALFDKLKQLTSSMEVDYKKYIFMKDHSDEYAFSNLRNLVSEHYHLFQKKQLPAENLEPAYADLMAEYYELSYPRYAREVYVKALEVYPKGVLCKAVYMDHLSAIFNNAGYYDDENNLRNIILELESADSLFHNPEFTNEKNKLKKYLAVACIRNEPENDSKTLSAVANFISLYGKGQYDTLNHLFGLLLSFNRQNNYGKINNNKLYGAWIGSYMGLKKQTLPAESVKGIHQYLIAIKNYDEDYDFISYCKLKYPALKSILLSYNSELEKKIVSQIATDSIADNPALMDPVVNKMNSKELKDKQYKNYYTKLTALLNANDYSGFAVNIVKALAQFPNDARFLTLKKRWVIADYNANYVNKNRDYGYKQYFSKMPDETNCEAGVVNKAGHEVVLQKINYCRRLAGVPDSCIFDDEMNVRYQKAALMMSANGQLSHGPPTTWKCYSTIGAGAAGSSNLSLGNAFADAIMSQMEDGGENNYACGHRRWILNPNNTVFGHGSTTNSLSLGVFGTSDKKLKRTLYFNKEQPICWPSTDYFPIRLMPLRWSFSLVNGEFEKAKVSVTENGKVVPVTIEPLAQGYGANSIVWYLGEEAVPGKIYTVTISNVTTYAGWNSSNDTANTKGKSYTYKVIPIETEQ